MIDINTEKRHTKDEVHITSDQDVIELHFTGTFQTIKFTPEAGEQLLKALSNHTQFVRLLSERKTNEN